MDLSGLKWPIIIVVIVLIGWLMSSGGVNYMVGQYTKAVPGADAARDEIDEKGLTMIGGYLLRLWRWEKALEVMQLSIDRYGETAPNYWYNVYRQVRCFEKLRDWQAAHDQLLYLVQNDVHEVYDSRVPNNDNLSLRAAKIKEVQELP